MYQSHLHAIQLRTIRSDSAFLTVVMHFWDVATRAVGCEIQVGRCDANRGKNVGVMCSHVFSCSQVPFKITQDLKMSGKIFLLIKQSSNILT